LTGSRPSTANSVSVLVVNWNTRDLLEPCLRSVTSAPDVELVKEVVVVDNGSTDGSAEYIATHWPQVTLLRNEENLGYTRASNQGLTHCTGDFVLLLNTDAWVVPDALGRMVRRLVDDPRAAVIGPRLEYGDGTWQRWTAGVAPNLRSATAYLLFLDRMPRWALRSLYLGRDVDEPLQRDWVSSACMLVRADAVAAIGGMDESFFCYMDDVDVCQRLRDRGWTVWYDPGAHAVHLMGQSTKRQTAVSSPMALRNFNRYFSRQHGRRSARLLRALEASGFGVRAAVYGGRAALGGHREAARIAARQHWRNVTISLEGDR
jgi:N-acetylglucosaminyl-diphospho-decaprenol L-rhamnosyltransferase